MKLTIDGWKSVQGVNGPITRRSFLPLLSSSPTINSIASRCPAQCSVCVRRVVARRRSFGMVPPRRSSGDSARRRRPRERPPVTHHYFTRSRHRRSVPITIPQLERLVREVARHRPGFQLDLDEILAADSRPEIVLTFFLFLAVLARPFLGPQSNHVFSIIFQVTGNG